MAHVCLISQATNVSRMGVTIYLAEGIRTKRGEGTKPRFGARTLRLTLNELAKHTGLASPLAQTRVGSQPH